MIYDMYECMCLLSGVRHKFKLWLNRLGGARGILAVASLICYSCCPYPTTFDAIIPDEVSWSGDGRPESVGCAYLWEALCGVYVLVAT